MSRAPETMGYIRKARPDDAAAITELRLVAYRGAPEFSLIQPETLQWSKKDEDDVVLAAWNWEGQALSTTRGEVYLNQAMAEEALECSLDSFDVEFPVFLLGKGATRPGHGRQGLHSALRYHLLTAVENTEVRTILGIVYADAPRTRLMAHIGYEFVEPKQVWYTDLAPHRRTLIGVLRQEKLSFACERLGTEVLEALKSYPLIGPDLSEHIAQRVASVRAQGSPSDRTI